MNSNTQIQSTLEHLQLDNPQMWHPLWAKQVKERLRCVKKVCACIVKDPLDWKAYDGASCCLDGNESSDCKIETNEGAASPIANKGGTVSPIALFVEHLDWNIEGEVQIKAPKRAAHSVRFWKIKVKKGGALKISIQDADHQFGVDVFDIEQEAESCVQVHCAQIVHQLGVLWLTGRLKQDCELQLHYSPVGMPSAWCAHGARLEIEKGASGAQIEQQMKVLNLGAKVWAAPWLKIGCDQVQARHGVAIGGQNPQAVAYLRSRGIDEKQSQSLLAQAHFLSCEEI